MFNRLRRTELILILLLALTCTSCGQTGIREYIDRESDRDIYQDTEEDLTYDDTADQDGCGIDSDVYDGAEDLFVSNIKDSDNYNDGYAIDDFITEEDNQGTDGGSTDNTEDQVVIPDGVSVVRYTGDREQLFGDMYMEMSYLPSELCLIGGSFDRNDFFAMPYSGFWITDYTTQTETGTDPMTGEEQTYTFYRFTYDEGLTTDALAHQKDEIDQAAQDIIAKIPISADTWTQIRIVHDELCRMITFDDSCSKPHIYDMYGALVNHVAVCNGYACAFNHIMGRLGIDSRRIYSDDHAWNYANVPAAEQYLDITWDDTDCYDQYGNEYVNYAFLFLTLDEMKTVEQHQDVTGEASAYEAFSESYNYYVHEGYYIYDYSWDDFVEKMRRQYETGTNLLTVRFASEEDYQMAKSWFGSDRHEFDDLLRELNYTGTGIYTWYRDDLRTMSIGLYAPKS